MPFLSTVVVGPFVENLSQSAGRNVEKEAHPPSEHLVDKSVAEKNYVEPTIVIVRIDLVVAESVVEKNYIEAPANFLLVVTAAKKSFFYYLKVLRSLLRRGKMFMKMIVSCLL